MKLEETFTHFLLRHQLQKNRTLNFVILMESILTAARYLQFHYQNGSIAGTLGRTEQFNVQGEQCMEFDLLANRIVMHYLAESNQVLEATSEEISDEIRLNSDGRYLVYFDPLDGSSNISHNLPVGFLFGIAKRDLKTKETYRLRSGAEFIASGIFLIPSGSFTFALKNSGAWRFSYDGAGAFVRPTRLTLPESESSWEISYNLSNRHAFNPKIGAWLKKEEKKRSFRYAGSLAIDIHRLLGNGGAFLYPAITNHEEPGKNRPQGKLRLMYEAAVVAQIIHEAGGKSVNDAGDNILEILPEHRHERTSLITGNAQMIEDFKAHVRE